MGHAPSPRDLRGSTVGFVVTHSHEASDAFGDTYRSGWVQTPSRVGGTRLSNERCWDLGYVSGPFSQRCGSRPGNRAGGLGNYAGSVFAARLDLDSMLWPYWDI